MKTMQTGHVGQWAIFSGVSAIGLLTPRAGFTEDPKLDSKSQQVVSTAFADEKPKPGISHMLPFQFFGTKEFPHV
jgi:hypothetical protein